MMTRPREGTTGRHELHVTSSGEEATFTYGRWSLVAREVLLAKATRRGQGEPPPDQAYMGPSGSEAKLWSSYSKTNTACPPGPLKKGIWKGKVESVGDNITISHDTITRYPTSNFLTPG